MLDQIENRLAKVGRFLKRTFANEKALDKALRESLPMEDKHDNVSVDDLKNFVLDTCKEQIINKRISKKDVEAFLSAFIYNAYGATNIESVSKLVYTDENYVAKKLSRKTRANPPPEEVNAEMLRSISIDREEGAEEGNGETASSRMKKTSIFSAPVDYQKAAAVLKEIEDKVYVGGLPRGGTFQTVFRSIFDVDGDGFVSHADFEGACRRLQVKADYHSVLHAIRALDTEQKGYLDYRTFSKKLTPGVGERMATLSATAREGGPKDESDLLILPDVGPSKHNLAAHIRKAANVTQTVREVRQAFNPDYDTSKYILKFDNFP